jgi:hypothetical protein
MRFTQKKVPNSAWNFWCLNQQRFGGIGFNLAQNFWRSRPESNRDTRIRNPLLYPFELREQNRSSAKLKFLSRYFKK